MRGRPLLETRYHFEIVLSIPILWRGGQRVVQFLLRAAEDLPALLRICRLINVKGLFRSENLDVPLRRRLKSEAPKLRHVLSQNQAALDCALDHVRWILVRPDCADDLCACLLMGRRLLCPAALLDVASLMAFREFIGRRLVEISWNGIHSHLGKCRTFDRASSLIFLPDVAH